MFIQCTSCYVYSCWNYLQTRDKIIPRSYYNLLYILYYFIYNTDFLILNYPHYNTKYNVSSLYCILVFIQYTIKPKQHTPYTAKPTWYPSGHYITPITIPDTPLIIIATNVLHCNNLLYIIIIITNIKNTLPFHH